MAGAGTALLPLPAVGHRDVSLPLDGGPGTQGHPRPTASRHDPQRARVRWICHLIVVLLAMGFARPDALQACVGDCRGNGQVAIDDLILGVTIALGQRAVTDCPAFADANRKVTIAQLIRAVTHALDGCPRSTSTATAEADAPPTETATPFPSPTNTPVPASVTLEISSTTGAPGSRVTIDVRLRTRETNVESASNDLALFAGPEGRFTIPQARRCSVDGRRCMHDGDCMETTPLQTCRTTPRPDCMVNPAIDKDMGTVFRYEPEYCCTSGDTACAEVCPRVEAVVLSLQNTRPIPDGSVLYSCAVDIASESQVGALLPLACSEPGSGDENGFPFRTECTNGQLTVGGPGDAAWLPDAAAEGLK
jgi:hypothetical protein